MSIFSKKQTEEIKERGISEKTVLQQIHNYESGFPFLSIKDSATDVNGGIKVLSDEQQSRFMDLCKGYGGGIVKFVPASGAASRMFKDLFQALDDLKCGKPLKSGVADKFFENVGSFPFFSREELLKLLLYPDALNYGSTPKGLVLFHKYLSGGREFSRTAFEEHLVEGAKYSKGKNGVVEIAFTVSEEHIDEFKSLYNRVKESYEREYGCKYDLSFSIQSPATDIIAVNEDNTPFLKGDGGLLFRPGGHGALINNLNSVNGDVVVIKNIDNVVREDLLPETVKWKQILIGKSIYLAQKCYEYLNRIDDEHFNDSLKNEILAFLNEEFSIASPNIQMSGEEIKQWIIGKLNRPIRVCGMVKNEGEPGGGPYIINEHDGSTSLQILEAAQIDKNNPDSVTKMRNSTHFNPVDLVCVMKNYKGERFNLLNYVDEQTGFISEKSYEGKTLKAQELPGLWNGSMSNWNTQFVEVPLITFNPVKTVVDLLRPEHNR